MRWQWAADADIGRHGGRQHCRSREGRRGNKLFQALKAVGINLAGDAGIVVEVGGTRRHRVAMGVGAIANETEEYMRITTWSPVRASRA